MLSRPLLLRAWRGAGALALTALLLACSSAPNRPEPAPLPPDPKLLGMRQVWSLEIDKVEFPLVLQVAGNTVGVASSAGQVSLLDGRTGEVQWRAEVGTPLNAGVGHDGRMAAVVTTENELVALQEGRELWRQRLNAPSYTAPLVAGARVFVLGADRSVSAYDGQSGRRLWHQTRSGEALVLRQPGVLIPVDDTLVVGLSGRLVGLNPLNGTPRWEVPIATPRGTNDVERLVDLVAGVARQGSVVCTRAFQAALGCVDAARGVLVWSKPAAGASGLSGDAALLLGVEFDGTVVAWRRNDGERAWSTNQLRYRKLSSPLLLGPALVVGDDTGRLHFLARQDGALQTRIETDGTPIAATPVLVGSTVVVVTRAGRVLGLRPE
ncbi:MAG: outer membrane protein assembly factor BamB [Burkholderiales bacterium]|nr:outer membrane protein assembly factor BamB [Burkholderiales bacterium]